MEERAYYMKRVSLCNDLDHFFFLFFTDTPALLGILLNEVDARSVLWVPSISAVRAVLQHPESPDS